jgi:hypothetical protein
MAQLSGHVERLWKEYADAFFKDTPVSAIQYQENTPGLHLRYVLLLRVDYRRHHGILAG